MRIRLLSISILGLLLVLSIGKARAEDDVFVDLSVLNEVSSSGSASSADPLFPEFNKADSAFPSVAPQKAVKKTKPAIAIKPKSKPAAKFTPEVKEIKLIPTVGASKTPAAKVEIKELENLAPAAAPNAPTPASILAPDSDLAANVDDATESNSTPISTEDSSSVSSQMIKIPDSVPEMHITPLVSPSTPKPVPAIISPEPEAVPSVPDPTPAPAADNIISYPVDEYELSDTAKQKIMSIISSFNDLKNNKISITSYNIDDGKDVFYKKRLSLNRAIEVRSYLLTKGYKNYSIKVINIPVGDPRENTLDITELT